MQMSKKEKQRKSHIAQNDLTLTLTVRGIQSSGNHPSLLPHQQFRILELPQPQMDHFLDYVARNLHPSLVALRPCCFYD